MGYNDILKRFAQVFVQFDRSDNGALTVTSSGLIRAQFCETSQQRTFYANINNYKQLNWINVPLYHNILSNYYLSHLE